MAVYRMGGNGGGDTGTETAIETGTEAERKSGILGVVFILIISDAY
jgi:hypothetical protein